MRACVVGLGVPVLVMVLVLGWILVLPGGALADGGGGLSEAKKLREASGTQWNAGQYAEAATSLRRAAEIYSGLPGDYSGDLAVVFRALVWNLTKTQSYEEAVLVLQKLMDLAKNVPTLEGELATAHSAFYEAARTGGSLEEQMAILAPEREAAVERGSDKLAAQILHDMGSFAREAGEPGKAIDLFEEALVERDRIGDVVGKTWSLNNLANVYLVMKTPDDAMDALLAAYRLVHEDRVLEPQASLAINVKDALKQLDSRPTFGHEHTKWIWRLAETGARSEVAEVIPSDFLLREAASMTERLPDKRSGWEAAKRLNKIDLVGHPVEVRANQTLAAAQMALDAGKAADGAKWLKKVEVGEGLSAAHLAARLHTLRAVAAGMRKKKRSFDEEATKAIAAWSPIGDRGGYEAALAVLAPLASNIEAKSATELEGAFAALRQQGKPGGLGGSASSGGDRSGYASLGLEDPLFEIQAKDGKILIRDVCANHETSVDVKWQPRSVGLNGLALTVFGSWVRIDGLNYGGGASSTGQPGTATLEALGAMRPVPGEGRMVILKNGAVTYRGE